MPNCRAMYVHCTSCAVTVARFFPTEFECCVLIIRFYVWWLALALLSFRSAARYYRTHHQLHTHFFCIVIEVCACAFVAAIGIHFQRRSIDTFVCFVCATVPSPGDRLAVCGMQNACVRFHNKMCTCLPLRVSAVVCLYTSPVLPFLSRRAHDILVFLVRRLDFSRCICFPLNYFNWR